MMSVLPCDDLATDSVDLVDGPDEVITSVFSDEKNKDFRMKGGYSLNDLSKEKTVVHRHGSSSVSLPTKKENIARKKGKKNTEQGYKRNPSEEVKKPEGYMRGVNGHGVNNNKHNLNEAELVEITVPIILGNMNTTKDDGCNREPDTVIQCKMVLIKEVEKARNDEERVVVPSMDAVVIATEVKEKGSSEIGKGTEAGEAIDDVAIVTKMLETTELNDRRKGNREPVEDDEDDHVNQRSDLKESIVTVTPRIVSVNIVETCDNRQPNNVDEPVDALGEAVRLMNINEKQHLPLEKQLKKTRNKCIQDRIGSTYPDNKENQMSETHDLEEKSVIIQECLLPHGRVDVTPQGDKHDTRAPATPDDTVTTPTEDDSNVTPRGINNGYEQLMGNQTQFTYSTQPSGYQPNNTLMSAAHQICNGGDIQYQYNINQPPLQSPQHIPQHSPELQYNGDVCTNSQYPDQQRKRSRNIDPREEDHSKRQFVSDNLPVIDNLDELIPCSDNMFNDDGISYHANGAPELIINAQFPSVSQSRETTIRYDNGVGRVIEASSPTTIKPILIATINGQNESAPSCSSVSPCTSMLTNVNNGQVNGGHSVFHDTSVRSPYSAVSSPFSEDFSPAPSTVSVGMSPSSSVSSLTTGPPSNYSSHLSPETGYDTEETEELPPSSYPHVFMHEGVQKIYVNGSLCRLEPEPMSYSMPTWQPLPNQYYQSTAEHVEYMNIEATPINKLTESDDDGDTVLHIATAQRNIALCKAMIFKLEKESKTTLDAQDNLGQTPLSLAILTDLQEIIDCLITAGASISKSTNDGQTIFHCAAERGFIDAVITVCNAIVRYNNSLQHSEEKVHPDMDAKNNEGLTALHVAVISHGSRKRVYVSEKDTDITVDSTKMIELLLKMGSSILCQDGKSGKTALHFAAERGEEALMTMLLNSQDVKRELVNYPMYNGNTALHLVVGSNRAENEILRLVDILWSGGADPSIENAEKEKAIACSHQRHRRVNRKLKSGQSH